MGPRSGTSETASAKGSVISKNRRSSVRVGVSQCLPNQAAARAVVSPIIKILMATHETT